MSELQLLHQLQEIDLQIEAQNRALQEIEAALGESSELASARTRVTHLQDLLHEQQKRLRDLEWDVDESNRHAQQDEQRLYSGEIRNPKELDGLRRDLEQRQARRRELEDQELQVMADVEATQASLRQAEEELARAQAEFDSRIRELRDRQTAATTHAAALGASRVKLASQLTPPTLNQYERLRRDKRGRAISKVERSTCQGCRIALPMGLVQRVRAGREFVYCPSCGRILYT